jgi:hypothetical protein
VLNPRNERNVSGQEKHLSLLLSNRTCARSRGRLTYALESIGSLVSKRSYFSYAGDYFIEMEISLHVILCILYFAVCVQRSGKFIV